MTKRRDVRVVPDKAGSGWAVKVDGDKTSGHRTKAVAVDKAIASAKRGGEPSSLKIHKQDGTIQEERTYGGKDPFPPKG